VNSIQSISFFGDRPDNNSTSAWHPSQKYSAGVRDLAGACIWRGYTAPCGQRGLFPRFQGGLIVEQGVLRWSWVLTLLVVQGCASDSKPTPPAPAPPLSLPAVLSIPTQNEAMTLLNSNQFAELDRRFSAIQSGYKSGSITDENLRAAFRAFYATDAALERKYDAWVEQFPKSYVARLARGIYYKKVGQERRGSDFVSSTSDEQLRGMETEFQKASGTCMTPSDWMTSRS
jgi:Domain of unknown function (DUF4034)